VNLPIPAGGSALVSPRFAGVPWVPSGSGIPLPELAWSHASGFYAGWDSLYVGKFYADNANQVETDDYRDITSDSPLQVLDEKLRLQVLFQRVIPWTPAVDDQIV